MKEQESYESTQETKFAAWVDLVVDVSRPLVLDWKKMNHWMSIFNSVTLLGAGHAPLSMPSSLTWKPKKEEWSKSEQWNACLASAKRKWVLFVDAEEELRFTDFPTQDDINPQHWSPALILHTEEENRMQHYQMRLVHKPKKGGVFTGKNLPDCTQYILAHNITLSNLPVIIEREDSPMMSIDPEDELGISDFAPALYLVEGYRYFKENKYVHAAAQYRQLLKMDYLLPFDRLAAVNGLATCLAEQHRWDKAIILTEQSLEAEPFQYLPYLIQYRIYQLQKQWQKAYEALSRYMERMELHSQATYDIALSEEETLTNLADLCLRNGQQDLATEYLNELFNLKNGEVNRSFLNQLLVMSIELGDEKKARFFFNTMFDDAFPNNLTEEDNICLNDYMDMFLKQGWFDMVYEVYSQLYEEHRQVDEYKRRLIVAAIKTNRVEQARRLATKEVA